MIKLSEFLGDNARPATKDELSALAKQFKQYLIKDFLEDDYPWMIFDGDLLLPTDVYNDMGLIVTGNLSIHGTYDDYAQGQIGSLVCTGSLWAENVFSWGSIFLKDDLLVDGVLCTYYNDFSFELLGNARARAILIDDKAANEFAYKAEVYVHTHDGDDALKGMRKSKKLFVQLAFEPDFDGEDSIPQYDRLRAHFKEGVDFFQRVRPKSKKTDDALSILARRDAPKKDLETLAQEEEFRLHVAVHPACPSALLENFAQDANERLRQAAASHPQLEKKLLAKLVEDPIPSVRRAVEMNLSYTGKSLTQFSPVLISVRSLQELQEEDRRVREELANPAPEPDPWEEIERVSVGGNANEREQLALAALRNDWPFSNDVQRRDLIIAALMLDSVSKVRQAASCAWLPQSFYNEHEETFLQDPADDVRFVLALRTRNHKTLEKLSNDKSSEVSAAALMNPNCPEELLLAKASELNPATQSDDAILELQSGLFYNTKTPAKVIALAYKKRSNMLLARHVNAPPEVVVSQICDELKESKPALVSQLALHKDSNEAFSLMAKSEVEELERIAAGNSHTPPEVIKGLLKRARSLPMLLGEFLHAALARNPALPMELFTKFSKDEQLSVRRYLCENPNCPVEILRKLARDDSLSVSQTARLTLQKLYGEDSRA